MNSTLLFHRLVKCPWRESFQRSSSGKTAGIRHILFQFPNSLLDIQAFHPDAGTLMDSLTSIGFKGNFSAKKNGVNEKPVLKATLKYPNEVVTLKSAITGG